MSRLRKLLNPESRDSQELRLSSQPDQAVAHCRDVVRQLGWAADEDTGDEGERLLTIREDPAFLCCGDSPIRIEVGVRGDGNGGSIASVEGIVPGVGGVADKHLHRSMRGFVVLWGRRDRALVQD